MELECHLGYLDHKQWTSIWREQKGVRETGQVGESLGTRGDKGIHLSSMMFEPRLNAKELKVQRRVGKTLQKISVHIWGFIIYY